MHLLFLSSYTLVRNHPPARSTYAFIPKKGNFNPPACYGDCYFDPHRILKPVHRVLLPDLLIPGIRSRRHGHLSVDCSCPCTLLCSHRIRNSDRHFQICCQGRTDRELPCLSPVPLYRLSGCHVAFDPVCHFHLPLFRGNCDWFPEGGTDCPPFTHHFTFNPHGYRPFLHQWLLLWN